MGLHKPYPASKCRQTFTGYTGNRKTKREGGGATVAVSADGEIVGRTQIIRQQKSLLFFPLLVS